MYKEVSKLGKRDKEIIELRYGLNGKKEMNQKIKNPQKKLQFSFS